MFVYEIAAELKAQTERMIVIYSKSTINTFVNVFAATYQYINSFTGSSSKSRSKKRRSKRKRIVPPSPSFASTVHDEDDLDGFDLDQSTSTGLPTDVNQLMEQMRILQEQMEKFAKMQSAMSQLNSNDTSNNSSNNTTPNTSTINSSKQASGSDIVQIDPNAPPCPILEFDVPGAGTSYSGSYASSQPIITKKPAAAPPSAPQGMSIVDLLKNGRPQLRSVSQSIQDEKNAAENGTSSDKSFSNVFNKSLAPSKNQKKLEPEEDFAPVPLATGKKVQSQSLPGQSSMSFSDMIKVASKVSLRRTDDTPRSPGGTPRRKEVVSKPSFLEQRLQEKFKRVNRPSLNPIEEKDPAWD